MDPALRVCIDRILPADRLEEAARRAIAENPANAPDGIGALGGVVALPEFAAVVTRKLWRNGRTLRVGFLGGDTVQHAKVERHARRWEEFANIKFVFDGGTGHEIRVAFVSEEGSWSYIGTDGLTVPPDEPTMNFGWVTAHSVDIADQSVILHEFGHALGCIHEHQSPASAIEWDEARVYQDMTGAPNHWDRADTDRNVLTRYSKGATQYTAFDSASIMVYPIPKEWTRNGISVPFNTELSPTDREFIARVYPKPA